MDEAAKLLGRPVNRQILIHAISSQIPSVPLLVNLRTGSLHAGPRAKFVVRKSGQILASRVRSPPVASAIKLRDNRSTDLPAKRGHSPL